MELAVSSALQILKEASSDNLTFSFGVGRRVDRACKDLQSLVLLLSKIDANAKESESVIPDGMTEDAFKLEDAAEAFANKADNFRPKDDFIRTLGSVRFYLVVRFQIRQVAKHIALLTDKVQRSITTPFSEGPSCSELDLYSSHGEVVEHEDLVGIEWSMDHLLKLLMGEPPMVFVCGTGGLGKTTLARKVYRHAIIRDHFDGFAWADVSKKLSVAGGVRDLWESVLVQLCCSGAGEKAVFGAMKEEEIAETLFNTLRRKKCLIVFDDVYDFEIWGCLKTVIPPEDETGSRILVTTRMTKEAKRMDDKNLVLFELQRLNEHDSWKLFEKRVHFDTYVTDSEDHKKMKQLGKKMVKNCDGLPLAIAVLSGFLSTKSEVDEWERFRYSIKRQKKKAPQESSLSLLLNFSYDEMSDQLRNCFLHLAQFPENFEIRAKELCQIWEAEQFVPSIESTRMDAAYECLNKLVKRCLIQVRKWSSSGRSVKTCCVHDSVREFCLSKARSERFLQVVNFRSVDREEEKASLPRRRLAIYLNNNVDAELLPFIENSDKYLRSFICFNPAPNPFYEKAIKLLFNNFLKLRVLKFENASRGYVGRLPKEIEKLRCLRFLSLKDSYVEHLPSSIGKLRFLQTLDLRTNWRSEFQNVIWKLIHLRHLYLPQRSTLKGPKLCLENLSSLQTLVSISTDYCDLKDVMQLKNLVKLKVQVDNVVHLENNLRYNFDKLESLAMENCSESQMDLIPLLKGCREVRKLQIEGKITRLPEDIQQFHPTLMKLRLKLTCLETDPMARLEKLRNLKILLLDYNSFEGKQMVCSAGGFPQLESLSLVGLENLEEWSVEDGAMNSLSHLHINYCYKLKTLPDGLKHVATLMEVVIERMPREFKRSFMEKGKEQYIVRYVTIIEALD